MGIHIDWVWSLGIVAPLDRETAAKTFNYYKIHITSVSIENYNLVELYSGGNKYSQMQLMEPM